jgi:hypothetical protein
MVVGMSSNGIEPVRAWQTTDVGGEDSQLPR